MTVALDDPAPSVKPMSLPLEMPAAMPFSMKRDRSPI